MLQRACLLALLIYVTLDLSLPAMPGAFVFEPEDSVESLHLGRGRAADVGAVPVQGHEWLPASGLDVASADGARAIEAVASPPRPPVHRFPRAARAPSAPAAASPLDDPH
jgi:hypothetical protein